MSIVKRNLQVCLDMVTIENQQIPDTSQAPPFNGKVTGAKIVHDNTLGRPCLALGQNAHVDVDLYSLHKFPRAFTVETWVFFDQLPSPNCRTDFVLNKRFALTANGTQLEAWDWEKGYFCHRPDTKPQEWLHVAAVINGQTSTMYINGEPCPVKAASGGSPFDGTGVQLGGANDDSDHAKFSGRFGRFRFYDSALQDSEVRQNYEYEKPGKVQVPPAGKPDTAVLADRPSPLVFDFFDADHERVLHMDDGSPGVAQIVEIQNVSPQAILFEQPGDTASASDHHFALRFKRGAVKKESLQEVTLGSDEASEWNLGHDDGGSIEGASEVSLYLRRKTADSWQWQPNEKIRFDLHGLVAAPAGGSRGTNIELKYQNLSFAGATGPLQGTYPQYVNIVAVRGKRQIPLHVGIKGAAVVMNDGKENTLSLSFRTISTPGTDGLALKGGGGDDATHFVIGFDVAAEKGEEDWGLLSKGDMSGLEMTVQHSQFTWDLDSQGSGITKTWTLRLTSKLDTKPTGEFCVVDITNLKTTLNAGIGNIYVHYHNVPGYWDGIMTIPVAKSPLRAVGRRIAVGVRQPQDAVMHVQGERRPGRSDLSLAIRSSGSVQIDGLPGQTDTGLQVRGTTPHAAIVEIEQGGAGKALIVGGGSRLNGSLEVRGTTDVATVYIEQDGAGNALIVGGTSLLNGDVSIMQGRSLKIGTTTLSENDLEDLLAMLRANRGRG